MISSSDGDPTPIHALWGEFPNTVLEFHGVTSFRIDLREPISTVQRRDLADAGFERSFGILTAENPGGQAHPSAQNATYSAQLRHELEEAGVPYTVVDAHSPDHTHTEASVALTHSRDAVVALAIRYDQLAIFWFDGQQFWIVPATALYPPLALPVH